ncbi:Na/Pi cotransporter family protein [Marinobacterium arenosum]|uniref:Na/Pi cotransporter family protein n=1 Tax=Marinobacterium arenosum TaxID=2862496 RepID=UPI001C93EB4C|nr:Na/Pi symporter [Marinobacterium arenosum]MBY4678534.1 Na/Pi symporter [Marinobacterium arenosum]
MLLSRLGELAGGLGLFLLGMHLMTNGLRSAAGPTLKRILNAATESRLRGLASGTLITALVQSSTAVTVATIGFVNAGLLSLGQSIAVIYGCNVGTTVTGWLVALIGFKVKIAALALPMIAVGMVVRLVGGEKRTGHVGFALAGFGLFFLGLGYLKDGFAGLDHNLPLTALGDSLPALALFVLAGFVLTFLLQSSAAALAITLSLAASGSITLLAAGALVIGANLGTTSTAVMAALTATANAKRIAAAHVLFNLATGTVGLLVLMLASLWWQQRPSGQDHLAMLALFHTLFNLAGVLLMWPLTDRLERFLKKRFKRRTSRQGVAQFLDKTTLSTPSLAVEAMRMELIRLSSSSLEQARAAISAEQPDPAVQAQQAGQVFELSHEIARFNRKIAEQQISEEISEILPAALRVARYFAEVARLAQNLEEPHQIIAELSDESLRRQLFDFEAEVTRLLELCEISERVDRSSSEIHQAIESLERHYQRIKEAILDAAIAHRIKAKQHAVLLDTLSHIHRLAQQAEKGARHWPLLTPMQHREPLQRPAKKVEN